MHVHSSKGMNLQRSYKEREAFFLFSEKQAGNYTKEAQ